MKSQLARYFVSLPRPAKVVIVAGVDLVSAMLCGWILLCLYDRSLLLPSADSTMVLVTFSVLQVITLWLSQAYRTVSRFMGLTSLAKSVQYLMFTFVGQAIFVLALQPSQVPLSFGLEQPALFLAAFLSSRFLAARFLGLADKRSGLTSEDSARAIIYGAGEAGRELAMGLAHAKYFRVVAFVDEDQGLQGAVIQGLSVHSPAALQDLIESRQVGHLLLAMPSVTRTRRAEIVKSLAGLGAKVMTLPSLSDLAHGRVSVRDLREVDIEDLLGRETTKPNEILLNKDTRGKVVLVTGAGGSIGSEICRQVLQRKPLKLILVEISEVSLYTIDTELQEMGSSAEIVPVLCNIQDLDALTRVMMTHQPDTVYHAAAYKHVPLVEANECAGVLNNIQGTWNTAHAAITARVSKFTLISTDKAVRPTNIMGASKRVAELILQALSAEPSNYRGSTQFSMVRFGNVLGSSGSVVPRFKQQIEAGGPITLTHKDITRYFMTIPEATELVLQAGAMGGSGEVFVLDMGEPVKIIDLAYRMVELSGLTVVDESHPDGEIAIEITGLRPGEKLFEELLIGNSPQNTSHPGIFMAKEEFLELNLLKLKLEKLVKAAKEGDAITLRSTLPELVIEYTPNITEMRC